jgi:hypothetical protein
LRLCWKRKAISIASNIEPALRLKRLDLHISPNVEIAAGDLSRAEEDVATIATGTIDSDRVFATIGSRAVERDFTALIAVWRVNGPCGLVPAAFEVVGDLRKGERKDRESEEEGLAEHCGGCMAVGI